LHLRLGPKQRALHRTSGGQQGPPRVLTQETHLWLSLSQYPRVHISFRLLPGNDSMIPRVLSHPRANVSGPSQQACPAAPQGETQMFFVMSQPSPSLHLTIAPYMAFGVKPGRQHRTPSNPQNGPNGDVHGHGTCVGQSVLGTTVRGNFQQIDGAASRGRSLRKLSGRAVTYIAPGG
jgi:hypothetical protein